MMILIYIFLIFIIFSSFLKPFKLVEGLSQEPEETTDSSLGHTSYVKDSSDNLCVAYDKCGPCNSDGERKCNRTWKSSSGMPCFIYDNSGDTYTETVNEVFTQECETDKTLSLQGQLDYATMLNSAPKIEKQKVPEENKEDLNPVKPDMLVDFIENATEQINDAITSETVFTKLKKFISKVNDHVNKSKQIQADEKLNIEYEYNNAPSVMTRDDKPDSNIYQNINLNPKLISMVNNPLLIDENNINDVPLSYDYMEKLNEPAWYNSMWKFRR